MEVKSDDFFFIRSFCGIVEYKKIREVIREGKMEKTKAQKQVDVKLFIFE